MKQTKIYFVRHAEPDLREHNDRLRTLTAAGEEAAKKVTQYLLDKEIDAVLSSPYRRAVQTVQNFAQTAFLPIAAVDGFRERTIAGEDQWIEDFESFCQKQWEDFAYKLPGGESLCEVEERTTAALNKLLQDYAGKNIVVGTHGTALSVLLHRLDPAFGYKQFQQMPMPWIAALTFEGEKLVKMETAFVESENVK